MKYVFAFLAMVATDVLWAKYVIHLGDRRKYLAGVYSAGIVLLGGVIVRLYVEDAWTILPATVGAFCGTVWGAKRG